MERRFGLRKPIDLFAEVYHRGSRLGRFRARNVGLKGMFIESGPVELRKYAPVKVAMSDAKRNHLFVTKGVVVHLSEGGMGLVMDSDWPMFFSLLETPAAEKALEA